MQHIQEATNELLTRRKPKFRRPGCTSEYYGAARSAGAGRVSLEQQSSRHTELRGVPFWRHHNHAKKNAEKEATVMEGLDRRLLADIQVSVVGETGERYLVVAGYVEAKLAQAEISAGLRPAIQNGPTVTVLDLADEFRGANPDLEHAEAFLVAFIGNFDLVRLVPVANDSAIEIIVVHLEEDVVFGAGVVEYPLQEVTLGKHRGKNKGA